MPLYFESLHTQLKSIKGKDFCDLIGFGLLITWYLLAPSVYLINSWAIYDNVLVFAAVSIATLVGSGLLGKGRHIASRRIVLVTIAALSCLAGILFLNTASGIGRSILYSLQVVIFTVLLFSWGRRISSYSTRKVIVFIAFATLLACLIHFIYLCGITVSGLSENRGSATTIALFILSFFPLFSALLFRNDVDGCETASSNAAPLSKSLRRLPWMQIGILFAGSLITGLFAGLNSGPFFGDLGVTSFYRFILLAVFMLVLLLWALGTTEAITLDRISTFFVLILVMAVCGLTLFAVGLPTSTAFAVAIVLIAYDCFFILAWIIFCTLIRELSLRFFPVFAGAMIGIGMLYVPNLGVAIKKALGYDLSIITPIVIICISALAIIYFMQNSRHFLSTKQDAPEEEDEKQISLDITVIEMAMRQRNYEALSSYALTKREMQVLLQVLEGYTDADIAEKIHVKPVTVRYHISNAYHKAGVSSKAELTRLVKNHRDDETPAH